MRNTAEKVDNFSRSYNELVELKVDVLLRGIDDTNSEVQQYLKSNNMVLSNETFGVTNQSGIEELILFLDEHQVRINFRSNKNSIYKLVRLNQEFFLQKQDTLPKKYKIELSPPPACYFETSPLGYRLKNYITVTRENCLLINPKLKCDFDDINRCRFCGSKTEPIPLDDQQLLSEYLWAFKTMCRYLTPSSLYISTGAHINETESEFFLRLFEKINKFTGSQNLLKHSVFSLTPSLDFSEIDAFYKFGIGMLSFNMEFWNPDLFKRYCPGKNLLMGRKQYLKIIKYCIGNFGPCSVRTNFVLGLEGLDSIKNGIAYLSELGCLCTGTVFYPQPETTLDFHHQNSSVRYYIDVFRHIIEMSKKNRLTDSGRNISGLTGLESDMLTYSTNS